MTYTPLVDGQTPAHTAINTLITELYNTLTAFNVATPVGSIQAWHSSTPPTGWLKADGSAIPRVTYASLFALLGTTYGPGDGSTTFNLPDLRGRVPVGLGTNSFGGSPMPVVTLGQTGGEETHVLTTNEMVSHTHVFGSSIQSATGAGSNLVTGGTAGYFWDLNAATQSSDVNGGSDVAHDNMQPFTSSYWIIRP